MLRDIDVHPKVMLSALWASVMFCYVYGDYFSFYTPGKIAAMSAGRIGPLGAATDGVLLGVSAMMAIPAVMVCLSLALPANISRWSNVLFGLIYSAIMLLTMPGAPPFYLFLGVIEVALTLCVVVRAWTWPRTKAT